MSKWLACTWALRSKIEYPTVDICLTKYGLVGSSPLPIKGYPYTFYLFHQIWSRRKSATSVDRNDLQLNAMYCHSAVGGDSRLDPSVGTGSLRRKGSVWPTAGNGLFSEFGAGLEGPQLERR